MTTELAEVRPENLLPGFGSAASFDLAQRAAKLLSQSTLVPKEYQGNLANCVIALNMAARMQADPFMVMQNLFVVYGRPGWSSQFLIATANTCGRFSALRYEFVGTKGKDDWGCFAWAVERETGKRLEGSTVTIAIAKQEGWYDRKDREGKRSSKWPTMPQQMLMYRAAAWFVRAYAPELAMGMHTADEIEDFDPERDVDGDVLREIKTNANTEPVDIAPEDPPASPADASPADASPAAEAPAAEAAPPTAPSEVPEPEAPPARGPKPRTGKDALFESGQSPY